MPKKNEQDPNASPLDDLPVVYTADEREQYAQELVTRVVAQKVSEAQDKLKKDPEFIAQIRQELLAEIEANKPDPMPEPKTAAIEPPPTPTAPPESTAAPDNQVWTVLQGIMSTVEELQNTQKAQQIKEKQAERAQILERVIAAHKSEFETPLWPEFQALVQGQTESEIEDSVKALLKTQSEREKSAAEKAKKPSPPPTHGATHTMPKVNTGDVLTPEQAAAILIKSGITPNFPYKKD